MHEHISEVAVRITVAVAVVMYATTTLYAQPSNGRQQLQALRQDYGRATDALRQFDEQLKAKEHDSAVATLEEVVKLKAKLEKENLPSVIKRSVAGWDKRIQDGAKSLEAAGMKLPDTLKASTQPTTQNRPSSNRPTGNSRFDISGTQGIAVDGVRQLADYEVDSYGPLPYPEMVAHFVNHKIQFILRQQREDGSYEFVGGKSRVAGGTVGFVTQAALCGYSLRKHVEVNPAAIEPAIAKTLDYVVYMVRSGKLRPNVRDAAWRYVYSLRFLVNEYPHIKDEKTKALVEDACLLLLNDLRDMQQAPKGGKSRPVNWRIHVSPGMIVGDHDTTGRAVVKECPEESFAYQAGVRQGDLLLTANDANVSTTLAYYMEQMKWLADDTINLKVRRGEEEKTLEMYLPPRFPGTLGFAWQEDGEGRVNVGAVESAATLSGIVEGDQVTQVGDTEITSAKQLEELDLYSGQVVKVEVKRQGKSHSLMVECMPAEAATLGLTIQGGLDQSTKDGLEIQRVANDSCLKETGLASGDRILRINDTLVVNRRIYRDLERTLWAGKEITVTYLSRLDGQEKTVKATAGARPYQDWLSGYHGVTLERSRSGEGAIIKSVDEGSPADVVGCRVGDEVEEINGLEVTDYDATSRTLASVFSGQKIKLTLSRQGETENVEFTANRPAESPWISANTEKGGGWVYYTYVRGGTTFLSSDALRVLVRARDVLPIQIPDELVTGPFLMLSNLRMQQPNGAVESYRYDAGGSFWGVRDIRGDVGRLCAAELACLMYSESDLECDEEMVRTQVHLDRACNEFLKYRGILDSSRGNHAKFSIAMWYWPYSYLTTMQAADYLTTDTDVKDRVQRACLKACFKFCKYQHIEKLDSEGWLIGLPPHENPYNIMRSCLMLDSLATVKHLYRPKVEVAHKSLQPALEKFNAWEYGEAYRLLDQAIGNSDSDDAELVAQAELLRKAMDARCSSRLGEIKQIHEKYYRDAIRYLEETRSDFAGHPRASEIDELLATWKAAVGRN